jgi:protein-S-isoprenylcysteine O-methyltransferase Ste14
MPAILAALVLVLMVAIVVTRVVLLRRLGVSAMEFGKTHKTDFFLPPFVLFYFYLVFAHAFGWLTLAHQVLFLSSSLAWVGVSLCALGLVLMAWSVVSFGRSFRVGIDTERPGTLVTTGAFAFSRNPIYTAFAFILVGQFLVFPNWIPLLAIVAGFALFHRQVLREEAYLRGLYGDEYTQYTHRVHRYI